MRAAQIVRWHVREARIRHQRNRRQDHDGKNRDTGQQAGPRRMQAANQWHQHHQSPEPVDHGGYARQQFDEPPVITCHAGRGIVMAKHGGQNSQRRGDQHRPRQGEQRAPQHRRKVVKAPGRMPRGIGEEAREPDVLQRGQTLHHQKNHNQHHDGADQRGTAAQAPD